MDLKPAIAYVCALGFSVLTIANLFTLNFADAGICFLGCFVSMVLVFEFMTVA